MAALLKPSDCIVLNIERVTDFEVQDTAHDVPANRTRFIQAANLCSIPVFSAARTPAAATSPFSGHPIYDLAITTSSWIEAPLGVALAATGRPCLLLCGHWLDECITFTALKALGEGYDVYLLADVAPPLDSDARDTTMLRLVQAGIVPTTTRQAIREWAADSSDLPDRAASPSQGAGGGSCDRSYPPGRCDRFVFAMELRARSLRFASIWKLHRATPTSHRSIRARCRGTPLVHL